MSIFDNPLGRSPEETAQLSRRKGLVQSISVAASVGSGTFFGALFIAGWSVLDAARWAGLALVVAFVAWTVLCKVVPPKVPEEQLLTKLAAERAEQQDSSEERTSVGGWVVAGVLGAPLIVLVMLLACWLSVGILVVFWIVHSSASLLHVGAAVACTVLVVASVEFGVEHPLMRRWGLPLD